jgi:RNA polymerase sigma factor for flagellar operon FliA
MQEVGGADLIAHAQARDELVESSLEFADKMVWSVMRRYSLRSDYFDELRSAALYGLVEAAERYDPKRGGAFLAFAQLRVRGAIIDYIRSCFLVSGRAYKAIQAQRKAQDIFEFQMDPLKKDSGDSLKKIYDTASTMALSYALSFDQMEDLPEQQDRSTNPEEQLIKEQRMKMLVKALRKLPMRERNVIEQYYFRDRSLSEVVETKSKVSRSWLSRIHGRALRRLKKHITFMSAEFSSVKEEE